MTTFAYPKRRHVRTQKPRQYVNYRAYKPYLQQEFARTCVYCRQPDTIGTHATFGVDHYKPKSKFPAHANDYSNLYYCCSACNSRKRDHWPLPEYAETQFIPNPCDHVMFTHLRFQGDVVLPRTEPGRFTAELLDLNDPEVVEFRAFVFRMIDSLNAERREAEQLLSVISALIAVAKVTATQAAAHRQTIQRKIAILDADVARLAGN